MLFSRNDEQPKASELVSEMPKLKAGGTELRVPSIRFEARLTKYTVTSKLRHIVTKPKNVYRLIQFNYRNARAYISQTLKKSKSK